MSIGSNTADVTLVLWEIPWGMSIGSNTADVTLVLWGIPWGMSIGSNTELYLTTFVQNGSGG